MTVSSAYVPAISDGDGVSVIFPVPFRFDAPTDVTCTIYAVDGTARTPAFVVTGTGDPGGSLQITDGAPLVGEKVVRERVTNLRQPINYTSGTFPSKAHENSADRLVMMAQERDAIAGRTLRLGPLSLPIAPIPPVALGRALIRTAEGFGEGPTADEIAAAQAKAEEAIAAAAQAVLYAGLAATFDPALYALKATASAITAPWTFSNTVKFGATGVVHFGAADEANINYNAALRLQANTHELRNLAGTSLMLRALNAGAVSLYFNNAIKLVTTSTGVTVTGLLSADTVGGNMLATMSEAIVGALHTKLMTPLRTLNAMDARILTSRISVAGATLVDIALPAGYTRHLISMSEWLPNTDNTSLAMQVSDDGGVSFKNANYGYHAYGLSGSVAFNDHTASTGTSVLIAEAIGNLAPNERGVTGDIVLLDPGTKALNALIRTFWLRENAVHGSRWIGARHPSVGITHVRLFISAGALTSGHYSIESSKD